MSLQVDSEIDKQEGVFREVGSCERLDDVDLRCSKFIVLKENYVEMSS